jgi:hypothetical protein
MDKPYNVPVFPVRNDNPNCYDGMTLRDWFAGQVADGGNWNEIVRPDLYAKSAYALADAMLAEREKS